MLVVNFLISILCILVFRYFFKRFQEGYYAVIRVQEGRSVTLCDNGILSLWYKPIDVEYPQDLGDVDDFTNEGLKQAQDFLNELYNMEATCYFEYKNAKVCLSGGDWEELATVVYNAEQYVDNYKSALETKTELERIFMGANYND